MSVMVGNVATFADARPDKAHALKPLEEAAEVFAAWQEWHETGRLHALERLAAECADVVQATCNLLAALDIEDIEPDMAQCRKRNEMRGRRCV